MVAFDHEDARRAAEGLFEGHLDRLLDVLAVAPGAEPAAAHRLLTPPPKMPPKMLAEVDVSSNADVRAAATSSSGSCHRSRGATATALHALDLVGVLPVVAVLVVLLALVLVGQDVVRGVDLLEQRLGGLVVGIYVRVVLAGQLAVSAADLFVVALLFTPRIVIVLCHMPCTFLVGL